MEQSCGMGGIVINKQKIIDIYDNLRIRWWDRGKNVTQGWVNVQCPLCSDASNHCGTNPATGLFHCWKCGKKGSFVNLLMALSDLPFGQCNSLIEEPSVSFKQPTIDRIKTELYGEETEEEPEAEITTVLPKTFELITETTHFALLDSYLKRRRISIHTLIKYGCGICRAGDYMNRCIFPVYYEGKLVSYQGADMTGFASLKYQSAPLSMGRINDYLYGLDEIKKRMIIVEGILDKLRTGEEAVAAFTSTITPQQFKLIISMELDELYFCFDPEVLAYFKARAQAEKFRPFISIVEVVKLPLGYDPDKLGQEKVYDCILATHEE